MKIGLRSGIIGSDSRNGPVVNLDADPDIREERNTSA